MSSRVEHTSSLPVTCGLSINVAEMACYRFKVLPTNAFSKTYKESLCWLRVVTQSGFRTESFVDPTAVLFKCTTDISSDVKEIMAHKMYFLISQIYKSRIIIMLVVVVVVCKGVVS